MRNEFDFLEQGSLIIAKYDAFFYALTSILMVALGPSMKRFKSMRRGLMFLFSLLYLRWLYLERLFRVKWVML